MGAVNTVPVAVFEQPPKRRRRRDNTDPDAPSPGTLLPDGTRLPDGRLNTTRRPNRAQYYQPQQQANEELNKDPVARVLDMTLAAAADESLAAGADSGWDAAGPSRDRDQAFRRGLRDVFDAIDANGNGRLEFTEVKMAMQRASHHAVTDSEVRLFMSAADLDRSGDIDYTEFVSLMEAKLADDLMTDKACLEDVFHVLDSSGDGWLTRAELSSFFNGLSTEDFESPSESMLDEFMAEADTNGDGRIDYREFVVRRPSKCSGSNLCGPSLRLCAFVSQSACRIRSVASTIPSLHSRCLSTPNVR